MKFIKLFLLSFLGFLIVINPMNFGYIINGLFILIIILTIWNFSIDNLVKDIKRNWKEQTEIKKLLLKRYKIFNSIVSLSPFVYSSMIKIKDYEYFISFAFSILFLYALKSLKTISDLILLTKNELISIGNDTLAFKNINDILKDILPKTKEEDQDIISLIINDVFKSLKDGLKLEKIKLGENEFIFKAEYLQDLLQVIDEIIKSDERISKKEIFKKLSEIIILEKNEIEDLILHQGKIEKYLFGTDEYFIHNINKDKFKFCISCGSAKYNDNNDEEYFCSSLCKETEKLCEKLSEEINPIMKDGERLEEYEKRKNSTLLNANITITTLLAEIGVSKSWTKNFAVFQNKQAGHGLAAEIMNHENESFFKKAQLVGGNNAKNGPDRLVDRVSIQTKYYKTAQKTINSAFDKNGNYRYYDNNKPMTLEVPKDQYEAAVKGMQKKIQEGKVLGISDPNEAKNIIKKGSVTYQEAVNYSKFCSKESLKFDAKNGAVTASTVFGISFIINSAILYHNNKNLKDALKQSSIIAFKAGGQAFAVYMIGAQVQRIGAVNNFLQQMIDFEFKGVIGKKIGQALVETSGKKAGQAAMQNAANSALRGQFIAAASMMAVTSSIEVTQMMRGKISSTQCFKNIAINSSSIAGGTAGAIAGAALGSVVPVAGTMVGGLVGGMIGSAITGKIAKKFLEDVEDDLIKKKRIFCDHVITLAKLFKLSDTESSLFKSIIEEMVRNEKKFFDENIKISMILASSNKILKPIVIAIVSNRPKIPSYVFNDQIITEVIDEEMEEIINSK
ncbi:hypothetical protein H2278_06765 [Campylobacter sp. W0018]|uniref:hypothetical protein n=1 Tax=Campylobacter sp. W0018 TaxID=2735782 RepID=UPI00301BFC0F|nr:hypothetical protein [Campylobacter sp. W0018]